MRSRQARHTRLQHPADRVERTEDHDSISGVCLGHRRVQRRLGDSAGAEDIVADAFERIGLHQRHMQHRPAEQAHGLVFSEYFADDLKLLQTFVDDGLVRMTEEGLEVVSTGQLLIRNICMCFDVYLRNKARQQQFSRVI